MPLIAIPTTAGTGSEISPSAIITDLEAGSKIGIADNKLRPTVAIVDPLLTMSCPPRITAASGIDLLAHAIESFMAIDFSYLPLKKTEEDIVLYHGSTPLTSCLSKQAIKIVCENLPITVHQGQNLEARPNMAIASVMGNLACSNSGVTVVHAMAYPVGALTHAPHGVVNGILLPHVMEFNSPVCSKRLSEIAQIIEFSTQTVPEREAAQRAITAVRNLLADIGLPTRLSDIGVKKNDIHSLAERTMQVTRILRGIRGKLA